MGGLDMRNLTLSRSRISILSVAAFLFLSGTIAFGQPRIKFAETVHDFGLVKEGESVTHVFRFQNLGDEPLNIPRVKTP